jgi:putative ABC transport system substrate-binding protein
MRRRDFINVIASAVVAGPLAAHAQQSEQKRRIGVLLNRVENDPEGLARLTAFRQGLQKLGWNEGGNVQIDIRWGADDADRERKYAAELIALAPDILLASGTLSVAALQHLTRSVPIVFVGVTDPVGAGFVDSLARPGGNATGFMIYEYTLSAKWLGLLKEIAPSLTRVAVIRNPDNPVGIAIFSTIQNAARSIRVEVVPIDSRRDAAAIERAIKTFAQTPNGGLIFTPNATSMAAGYELVIKLATQHKLPTVYPFPYMVAKGGLMSFAADVTDQCRQAAEYVDRILKGEKSAADLPVQQPTKLDLSINLKTAKALGIVVPPSLTAQAQQLIE